MVNKLSSIQIQKAIDLYIAGSSSAEVAKQYEVTDVAIRGLLKRRGIALRTSKDYRRYTLNESFLDIIDTPEKAYFLGLFAADGSNNESKGAVRIKLAETDKPLLESLAILLNSNRPLLKVHYRQKNVNWQDQYVLDLNSKKLSQRLASLGLGTNKTHSVEFPKWLDKQLIPHFTRGLFDGDGSISSSPVKCRNGYLQYSVTITGNLGLVQPIKNLLSEMSLGSSLYQRHKNRNNQIFTLVVSGRKQIQSFYDWLYADASLYLERKKSKFNF